MIKNFIEKMIFQSKWILIPFYLRLVWTLLVLLYDFYVHGHVSNEQIMATLESVDIVMIANLIKMVITGSYHSFIDKNHTEDSESSSSGILKIKLSSSIIGVSSIHLLQVFINVEKTTTEAIIGQVIIHVAFILGCLGLAFVEYLHIKGDLLKKD